MLSDLAAVERQLPKLIADADGWNSLLIDYHPPIVERLYRNLGDWRVNLHRIHPCEPGEALFHPHPWPSAMRILTGHYEMAVGYGSGSHEPPVAALIIAEAGSQYSMTDPDAWHYVRPLDAPVLTVMITGKPWARESPKPGKVLVPLAAEVKAELLAAFAAHYPG